MPLSHAVRVLRLVALAVVASATMGRAALAAGPDVAIKLADATPPAAVPCPKSATFQAAITTSNWPATTNPKALQYRWLRSDGATGPVQTILFRPEGGTVLVQTAWSLSETYSGWQAIQVVSPVASASAHVPFAMTCLNTPTPRIIPTNPPAGTADAVITTKIHLTAPPDDQACPKTLSFAGTLTVTNLAPTAAKEVTFKWVRSDGASGPLMTAPLGVDGGSVHVEETWELGKTYTGWEALEVFSPHAYESHHHDFTLKCLEAHPQH